MRGVRRGLGFALVLASCAAAPAGCGRTMPILDAGADGGLDASLCLTAAECEDGLVCNGVELCDLAGLCSPGAPPSCDDGVLCTDDECDDGEPDGCFSVPNHGNCPAGSLCIAGAGCEIVPCTASAECQDPFFCNGAEMCVKNACVVGVEPTCQDFIDCTADACDEADDTCAHVPLDSICDDGLYCNGAEICTPPEGCGPGALPACGDEDDCTNDGCDEATDLCFHLIVDHDSDGAGAESCGGGDCNDDNPAVYPGATEACVGGLDEDCDGASDCADGACGGDPACDVPCAPAETATCMTMAAGSNDAFGSSDDVELYGGSCNVSGEDGPEYTWSFTAIADGLVAVLVDDLAADLDLFILDASGGSAICDPDACIAAGVTPGLGAEGLVFAVVAGGSYLFVVDGPGGSSSAYSLVVFCTPM